jgi:hypothetical protein
MLLFRAGLVLFTLALVASLCAIIFVDRLGEAVLGLLFGLGPLGWLVGFMPFRIAAFRARVMERRDRSC